MANDTRHEAVWDWLLTCPYIKDVFFNFSTVEDGGTVLVPLTAFNDTAEQEFVDGSSIRVYDFNIVHFSVYSTAPNDRQSRSPRGERGLKFISSGRSSRRLGRSPRGERGLKYNGHDV